MVKFDVFGPPAEPPPGMKVLKTGTVCQGTYRDGVLVKHKVWIVVSSSLGMLGHLIGSVCQVSTAVQQFQHLQESTIVAFVATLSPGL
jgi:hypothetical protein